MAKLFNIPDGAEFTGVKSVNRSEELEKAKKGTPEYEEWLRKYREKKGIKPKQQELPFPEFKGKNFGVSKKTLLEKPPKFVTDKEVWEKAVDKVTAGGTKGAGYGVAVAIYKLKLARKNDDPLAKAETFKGLEQLNTK